MLECFITEADLTENRLRQSLHLWVMDDEAPGLSLIRLDSQDGQTGPLGQITCSSHSRACSSDPNSRAAERRGNPTRLDLPGPPIPRRPSQ